MRLITLWAGAPLALAGLALAQQAGAQKVEPTADQPSGKELYEVWCAGCHDPGPGHPATMRMEKDFGPENSVLLEMEAINRPLIHFAARQGFQMMPPFRQTEITDEELDRIADYILGDKE